MTGHLTPREFVNLAEGARAESDAPHLQACDACRRRLGELRRMISAAAEVEAPEPSPLFWEHFSARVRVAVAAEGDSHRASWLARRPWGRLAIPLALGAAAAAALAVATTLRSAQTPAGRDVTPSAIAATATPTAESGPTFADDPSLGLVADLAGGYDWDAASEAGLTTSLERTDTAIGELSPDERQELERLLKQEMGRPGA